MRTRLMTRWALAALMCGLGPISPASAQDAAPASTAPAKPTRWTLVWSDEFNGPAGSVPNPRHWRSELGNQETQGWGNHELETYTPAPRNTFLDGQGHLVIRAERASSAAVSGPCWDGKPCPFVSGRISSAGKVSFREGKLEARIQVPAGQGIWPAFWSLGEDKLPWPEAGEIDVMEYVGKTPQQAYGTAHGPGYSGANGIGKPFVTPAPVAEGFHVFTVIKRPKEIIWQVDGVEYHRLTPDSLPPGGRWVFERPFFLILNLAVGGDWPGSPDASTVFPADMKVDWVRIYKED